jgi:hypothetical protein
MYNLCRIPEEETVKPTMISYISTNFPKCLIKTVFKKSEDPLPRDIDVIFCLNERLITIL